MPRITARRLFLESERIPTVQFYTSNIAKFLQARLVFDRAGLSLGHFKGHTEPYEEDYSKTKTELLQLAVDQVRTLSSPDSIFFVEDTSLRIDALSKDADDVPGLRVKEWFANTTFDQINDGIGEKPRGATIKSDIGLSLPGIRDIIVFHGEVSGNIAPSPSIEPTPARYPWLATDSFSGWFIPENSSRRLSEMDFESSQEFDFRIAALSALLDRLEEYVSATNAYQQKRAHSVSREEVSAQQSLFAEPETPVYVVIGPTCAGKTTFAEFAYHQTDFRHVEASVVLRTFASYNETRSSVGALKSAKDVLEERGSDFVARQIVRIFGSPSDRGIVITGFRTLGELYRVVSHWPHAKVVLVDSDERIRFERHLQRGRYDDATSLEQFASLDQGQRLLGMLDHARDVADVHIANEGTLTEYAEAVASVLSGSTHRLVRKIGTYGSRRSKSKLFRILKVLQGGKTMTSREMSDILIGQGQQIATRNVNWVLSHAPGLADRFDYPGEQIHYKITGDGLDYVNYIDSRADQEGK